ncbi:MAG: preprotein translocase subunit SecE [Defluviitaleaceae bacterium]|nr:preprotein translocase subunit SecE [Defluviitaleaceae bacterium]
MSKETKKKGEGAGIKNKLVSLYYTYHGEFLKIVWPGRPELIRKTITVAIISGLFGLYISVMDGLLGAAFTTLVGFLT